MKELNPQHDELIIYKPFFSAFFNTSLNDILQELSVEELYIIGAMTTSVFFTAIDAKKRGFKVTVIEKCVVSEDTEVDSEIINEKLQKYKIDMIR